ncbi:MAG: 4Fe-4S dicluster domain-containing protein [Candidatus Odinarchaeota archaeon]
MTTRTIQKEPIEFDPQVMKDIKKLGAFDVSACYNCGTCTVSCPLSVSGNEFPRKLVRYAVLGMKKKLLTSTEPWLCYYCGDCSQTCPSQAEPAEFMMATRRYLTTKYDWTGLSKKLYTSLKWEILATAVVALMMLSLFVIGAMLNVSTMVGDRVSINTFAPLNIVHLADLGVFAVLSILLLSNAFRMYYYVIIADKSVKVPFKLYFTEIKTAMLFVFHLVTQWRWKSCNHKRDWLKHLFLMSGYATMFLLIFGVLEWFQQDGPTWHWTALIGYYATFALFYVTINAMWNRYRKKGEMHRFSHKTDWLFLILLFFTTLTGILLHILRLLGIPYPSYYMYIIHIMVVGPMLILEVPFAKWSHMFYRPFAIYLTLIKEKAMSIEKT